MATPPPEYGSIAAEGWSVVEEKTTQHDAVRRWNIREVVTTSRVQNVASVVEQLLPQIKAQAEGGHSRSELILIPSNEDNARYGNLTGLDTERPPLIIQFEGRQNTTAFWSQDEVLNELRRQLRLALGAPEPVEVPKVIVQPATGGKSGRSSSWFGKSTAKGAASPAPVQKTEPVTIQVSWDDLHARGENEYGLYETKRAGAVFIMITRCTAVEWT